MEIMSIAGGEKEVFDHPVQETTALISEELSSEFDGTTVSAAEVTFRPGERTKFHTHAGVQVLYVTDGAGIVATRDEEHEVAAGDLIVVPSGEVHWHGTKQDAESSFSHVYVIAEPTGSEMTVLEAP